MMNIAPSKPEKLMVKNEPVIHLPRDLRSSEHVGKCMMSADETERPFARLRELRGPNQAFPIIQPRWAPPACAPDSSKECTEFRRLMGPADAREPNLVTVRAARPATVSLKDPILLNRRTLTGKQVTPLNAAAFHLRNPLPAPA